MIGQAVLRHIEELANKQIPPGPFDHDAIDPFASIERIMLFEGSIQIDLMDEEGEAINVPFAMRRRGIETKLIIADQAREQDPKLIANIAQALKSYELLKSGQSFEQIAQDFEQSKRRIQQTIDLAFIAPDIVRDVLNGRQPLGFTSDWCLRHDIPIDWQEQRALISRL